MADEYSHPSSKSSDQQDTNLTTASTSPVSKSAYPTTLADLTIHSPDHDPNTASTSIYKTLHHLRKATLSIPNRLLSVLLDAEFIEALWVHLNEHSSLSHEAGRDGTWPLIPNERSGSWPLDPSVKITSQESYLIRFSPPQTSASTPSPLPSPSISTSHERERPILMRRQSSNRSHTQTQQQQPVSAYFKSTDGHVNQWSFSTRRLNLQPLHLLGTAGGGVLIDTTRRGKSFPDALRRTVAIWCCVWNKVLFPEIVESGACDFQAYGLERGEIAQIESRIPRFVEDCRGLGLDLQGLAKKMKRPVRCVWVVQPTMRDDWTGAFAQLSKDIEAERQKWRNMDMDVNVLVCCSASKVVAGAEMSDEGYIQGAGDDGEGWSRGLTARVFWEKKQELMDAVDNSEDLESLVDRLVTEDKYRSSYGPGSSVLISPTRNICVGSGEGILIDHDFDLVIDCNASNDEPKLKLLGMRCKEGKVGSKMMRERLPQIAARVEKQLRTWPEKKILVKCSSGKDLSVGVVLVILCCFYADDGQVSFPQTHVIDKQFIKQRLAWITSSKPDANPSRATLQAVNSFLIGPPD
ncbi:tRNA A64-2'-O-ribosylphosphate transferase [Knufia obscura]|uniref:tRNA A64-2'-O-ribosylphosphate transferase n=1 Tax=Knufia obscura TaxID=1635080 RepID=A0ABR0RVP6_9EURO|nr:tRNA A64-2'-O-ribosylphosphate transferase [Knufia obscura]